MKRLKFPKMPPEIDGRYKVSPKYTEKMRKMREAGKSFTFIGKEFGLTKSAIMHRLRTPERKERDKLKGKRRREKIKNTPKLAEKQLQATRKHRKKKYTLQYKEMRAYDKSKGH